MAAVAVWKKVVSVCHSPPSDGPQSLQHFLFLLLWFWLIISLCLCLTDSRLCFYHWSAASSNSWVLFLSCSSFVLLLFLPTKSKWKKKIISENYFWNGCIKMIENACLNQNINLFILFKIREKEQAKWAKWARMLKNTFTDKQLCSLTCFFLFACLNNYENVYSFFVFEIRKNRLS